MKQNYKFYLAALLLVGATGMMTAGAQGSGKPTLAVFVVGMDNTLGDALATQIGSELNRNSRYTVLSSAADPVKTKLAELRTQGARNIDRNALAAWGRTNGVSTICLVTDDIKGNDHMFYAHLIDAKESKVSGRGSYIRTGVSNGDLPRVSLALSRQLDDPGRRRSAPAPTRSYPAELDIEMVFVKGGTFKIGCTAGQSGDCNPNDGLEYPHDVKVNSFYIGKYEITQAQWKAVMKGHALENVFYFGGVSGCGSIPCDDQRPVENVSWNAVDTAFLPRLNKITGKNYRLPTEAEWEYAARGCKGDGSGSTATCDDFKFSGSDNLNEVGWYNNNSTNATHPVGQKKPNALGIYDMSGNVWEWTRDWYSTTYYKNSPVDNPENTTMSASTPYRTRRSGGYNIDASRDRVAARGGSIPTAASFEFGLRVVLPTQ
jgi:formylglycine-generating enzyme required for sulfatase activity